IDGYFNDVDVEDISDDSGQEEFLDDVLMPLSAKRILLTIKYTKVLVRYIKTPNLNELIVKLGDEGTTTSKQSVVTRWLSLFLCAESVYSNYDATLLALESRRTTKYNLIDLLLLLHL
ncbi:unnamed protein product, partial [Didymodactylos carnosus]